MSPSSTIAPETYCIVTYGCQMNDNDSEIMSGILEEKGMRRVENEADADLVLVNTCVIRDGAEERAVRRLENLNAIKRRKKNMILGVTGCMAQKEGADILKRLPMADLAVGTRDLFKIGDIVEQFANGGGRSVSVGDVDKPVFLENQSVSRRHGFKAFSTIMYGCNNFCSFCIVPKTRGREVSRPVADIVREMQTLAEQGYREVMLLGQNVNSYRCDGTDFSGLLEAICEVDGIERIRFMTSHPKDCSDRLIDTIANLPQMCTNFHLPVQAGSNRVLRRMKRFYTRDHYLELLAKVRDRVPGATFTTDIICGFPGETPEDYADTCDLMEQARWDAAYIFPYSEREGTKSADWIDDVPEQVKKDRVHALIGRQDEISGEINATYVGSQQMVLVESMSKRRDTDVMGRTRGDKCVILPGTADLIGREIPVVINDFHPHTLFGAAV